MANSMAACSTGSGTKRDGNGSAPLSVGVVVPVYNEARRLGEMLGRLRDVIRSARVIVVDGGSSDGSAAIAESCFPTLRSPAANRGLQMNLGARELETDVLLFLHADSRLPGGFEELIRGALNDPKSVGGCFRLAFDADRPLLRFYSWCTRFPGRFFHFGDQGFFVRRGVFEAMGGYRELVFMEDVDLLRRLRRFGRFVIVGGEITTSARRFLRKGVLRQQLRNVLIVALFELGVPARILIRMYPPVR
jgi:rSAM/selenodomain-associated transferase 2